MYALIHNNQIQVGPRQWNYVFFKDYLEEENIDYSAVPRPAPKSPIVTPEYKILPVVGVTQPPCDPTFEQYAGPFWNINENDITGYYNVVPQLLEIAKGSLKEKVTATRYKVEVGGCKFTFADGVEVTLYTSREDRGSYMEALQIMPDGSSIVFKFPNAVFKTVTKAELGQMVATGAAHIQSAFVWEAERHDLINAATTLDELRAIDISHPLDTVTDMVAG